MRVTIRKPVRADEAPFIAGARRSRALHRHFASPPLTATGFRAALKRLEGPSEDGSLVIEIASQEIVGAVNLSEVVRGKFQTAYLGYYAFEPHAGQGLMAEGLSLVIRRAFVDLKLHRLEANIQPDNHRSRALIEKLGFRREGYSPRYLKLAGQWRDHERWALLKEEWRARRTQR